ncbi:MAG TPA: Fic family protein [Longimicrobium sp.]|nr:Fic family protein [Longimicrobium sp.]
MTIRCPPWSDERNADPPLAAEMRSRRELALAAALSGAGPDFAAGATRALRHWHRELFAGTAPLDAYAGGLRSDTAEPCLRRNVTVEGRLATDWRELPAAMDELDRGVASRLAAADDARARADVEWPVVAIGAVAWVMGEVLRIHPFLNGNGRISRLAMHVLLHRYGLRAPRVEVTPAPARIWSELARHAVGGDARPLRNYLLDEMGMYPGAEVAW